MDIIYLKDIARGDFYSGESGMVVGQYIDEILKNDGQITLSLVDIREMTPSFVNGAFIYPMELYGVEYVRQHLKITQATPTIAKEVKEAIRFFEQQKSEFFQKAKTNKIYLATDDSLESSLMKREIESLRSEGIRVEMSNAKDSISEIQSKIKESDFVIGIIANETYSANVVKEVSFAVEHQKKSLLLCRNGIKINKGKSNSKTQIIYYDNPKKITRAVNNFILSKKINPPQKKTQSKSQPLMTNTEALAWGALGLLVGAVLVKLFDND